MSATPTQQAPEGVWICGNCEDYNDEPQIKRHGDGWRHVSNNSVRCPGQGDDDTDDRVEPRLVASGRVEPSGPAIVGDTPVASGRLVAPGEPRTVVSTMSRVQPLPPVSDRYAAAGVAGASLVLTNDGDSWRGTFGVMLAALLADLVPEGAVEASVSYLDDSDQVTSKSGWIVGFDPASLSIDWADRTVTDGHSVLAIGI